MRQNSQRLSDVDILHSDITGYRELNRGEIENTFNARRHELIATRLSGRIRNRENCQLDFESPHETWQIASTNIESLSSADAKNITIALTLSYALIFAVTGTVVLIRRKHL